MTTTHRMRPHATRTDAIMKTFSSLVLLGTLGVLSTAAQAAPARPDTSKWTCETCPFEKEGVSGTVEGGLVYVSKDSARFGDYTDLDRKGGYLSLGGDVRWRGADGAYAFVSGSTGLGAFTVDAGREGLVALRLGYAEIPRHLSDTAMTPFLGVGSGTLTLPAGFPAATTAAMPLASTLQPLGLDYSFKRLDASAAMPIGERWTARLSLRHDVRDGVGRGAGSFFSTAAQLPIPIDHVTDQLELSARYNGGRWYAAAAYQASLFRNGIDALTWANPFTPVVAGATQGQLALAPDNQFHQVSASGGIEISPTIRATADVAFGRLTQDEPYLATTLNSSLGTITPPMAGLDGKVDTFNGSVRVTITPIDKLRINASYARDVRDNRTATASYTAVATDLFVGGSFTNTPFSFRQDRFKLHADYRGPWGLRFAAGIEEDAINRSYQEVSDTHETTVWGKVSGRPMKTLRFSARFAHAERSQDGYGVSPWTSPPENPLLRKFNLADRDRDSVKLRADFAVSEALHLGVNGDFTDDNYSKSPIGLTDARSSGFGVDASLTVSEELSVNAWVQTESIRSTQLGSSAYSVADWSGRTRDTMDVGGIGVKYAKDKLALTADLTSSRSRSNVTVAVGVPVPDFPTAKTALDSLRLGATWQLNEKMALIGQFWHERYDSSDWRTDGILPNTVPNLLAYGALPPHYSVNLLRVALRYRF